MKVKIKEQKSWSNSNPYAVGMSPLSIHNFGLVIDVLYKISGDSESWNWRVQYGCRSGTILSNLFCYGKVWKWHPLPCQLKSSCGTKWLASRIQVWLHYLFCIELNSLCEWLFFFPQYNYVSVSKIQEKSFF